MRSCWLPRPEGLECILKAGHYGPCKDIETAPVSELTYLSSIRILDEIIHESAQRSNRVASLAGQDWNSAFGLGYGLRINVLQEVKERLIQEGARELEKGLVIR